MIFSEIHSVYYNTVARIIEASFSEDMAESNLRKIVTENAFSESFLTILPALKSGKWQLMDENMYPILNNTPDIPLTTIEKRWLKAIINDPRIRLFDIRLPELEDVEPLFTPEDYKVYDKYTDGDPFEDESYIKNFRLILSAIKENRPVEVTMNNRKGRRAHVRFYPEGLEYSVKDDKMRVIATGCRFRQFNLGRFIECRYYEGSGPWNETPEVEWVKELTLQITDERNALERAMLHFAHFEKQAERVDSKKYILRLKYYEYDETEIVIRVLSFGPYVKILEPQSFVNLIKERLISQKVCELR